MTSYMDFLSNSIILPIVAPLFVLIVFLYVYSQQQISGKKTEKYHPVAANVFGMLFNFKDLHNYMAGHAQKYRTFRIPSWPLHDMIFTSDPANVEHMLKTKFNNYGKGKYTHEVLSGLLGDGIFTVDGDRWREQRKLSSHEFSTKVLRDFSTVIFRRNTIKLGNILSEAEKNKQIIDINDLFMKTTMDSIFNVGFGIDLDNMSGSSEEGVRFSLAFDAANTLTFHRFVDIFWKIKKYLNIGTEAELKKNMKIVDEFVYKLIQIKTEEMHKNKLDGNSVTKKDILSRFLLVKDNDPTLIRDVVINFVLAGKDPIGLTMSWFIYSLCKHPEIQDRVAKEIKDATNVKENITNVADFADYLSESVLEKMQYLHAALTETIRLYPALPSDPKICFSDDVLPDGCVVKKGEMISYMPYAMGKSKFIWGDDALEFKPERWLDDNGVFHPETPFKFTAFQAGLRACLGQDFAYKQLKIMSSFLLGCFVFKLSDENKVHTYRTSINLHVDGQLQVRVFNRFGMHNP